MRFFFLNALANADDTFVDWVAGIFRAGFGNVLNVIRIFGTGVALIMLTWMSISYFSADGRGAPWAIETKANIKGTQLRNFAIGVAIFIGASNLLYFIATFVEDVVTKAV